MQEYEMLDGIIDMHLHPAPSVPIRRYDFFQMARKAVEVNMRAIVLKPLEFTSMDKVYAAEKIIPGIRVFGGIVLDNAVGGLNPEAVENAIKRNAKFIWMPVFDADNTRKRTELVPSYKTMVDQDKPTLSVLDSDGKVKPEVKKIVEIIAKAKGVVLATGHISPEESIALIDEAKSKGIEHVVVTHVSSTIIGATIEQQKTMAEKGAILEHVFTICLPRPDREMQHPSEISDAIKAVGAKHCVMATDLGNYYHHPVDGFRSYILHMRALGISDDEIDVMIRMNPARILGI